MIFSRAAPRLRCLERGKVPSAAALATLETDGRRQSAGRTGRTRPLFRTIAGQGVATTSSPTHVDDASGDAVAPRTRATKASSTPAPTSSNYPQWNLPYGRRPAHSPDNSLDLAAQLRIVFQHLPQPAVICTSTSLPPSPPSPPPPQQSSSSSHGGGNLTSLPHAMTMSSLTPLSMDPVPVVSLNIMTPSRTLDAIRASGRFAVHVLAPTRAGVGIARWFARRHYLPSGSGSNHVRSAFHNVGAFVNGVGALDIPSTTEGAVAKPADGGTMPPILGGPPILFAFVCRLPADVPGQGIIMVRDHAIVVGEVEEVVPGDAQHDPRTFGMVYSRRRFWKLTNEVF